MKTIIISDINEDQNSIIPFGLNIGKHSETRVEIIHLIDPHEKQGTPSPYADSQTVSPADKLSHDEITQKESNKAATFLDRLLSKEASRLNYPLRISQTIEVRPVEKTLKNKLKEDPDTIMITGTRPASSMTGDLSELLAMVKEEDSLVLVVPPDKKFIPPRHMMMITDFSENHAAVMKRISPWLSPFNTRVHAFAINKTDNDDNLKAKGQQWMEMVNQSEKPVEIYQTGVLQGEDEIRLILDHVEEHKPDWVILPRNADFVANYIFAGKHARQLSESLGKPLLLF